MLGALTNRTPMPGDALPRAARLHAAAGHERHSCGELSAPWLSALFAINILLFTTDVKQCIPFSPPCDCSYELKITFCVRGVIGPPCGTPTVPATLMICFTRCRTCGSWMRFAILSNSTECRIVSK